MTYCWGLGFVINRLEDGLFIIRHADHTLLKFKKNRRRLEGISRQEYERLSISRVFILQQFS